MIYNSYLPAPALRPFIDTYWHLSGYIKHTEFITLMPDGGINLILNLGEDISSTLLNKSIRHEGVFLVGPMMQTDVQVLLGEVVLLGIKFKPGAFTHFYKYVSLDQVANQFEEFNRKDFPDIKKTIQYFLSYLNQFYVERLSPPKYSLLNIVSDISQNTGLLKIDTLARRHCTTERNLERQFNKQIGVSPKELINLERFNKAFFKLQNRNKKSLSDIAWECGYYDHAHLSNDFKRYTGKAPTEFILSDFSKMIAIEF